MRGDTASKSSHVSADRAALFGRSRPGGTGTPHRSQVPDGTITVPQTETRASATVAAPPSTGPNDRREACTTADERLPSPAALRPSSISLRESTIPRFHGHVGPAKEFRGEGASTPPSTWRSND